MRNICGIIVNLGGYRMAWVSYAVDNDEKTVRPAAWAGFERGFFENLRVSWADNEWGRGPTGTCIRTGEVRIGRSFLEDPELALWRDGALKRGFRSCIALPLLTGGKVMGALTIYAEKSDAFDQGQVELMRELADDLAFGLMALRARRAAYASGLRIQFEIPAGTTHCAVARAPIIRQSGRSSPVAEVLS